MVIHIENKVAHVATAQGFTLDRLIAYLQFDEAAAAHVRDLWNDQDDVINLEVLATLVEGLGCTVGDLLIYRTDPTAHNAIDTREQDAFAAEWNAWAAACKGDEAHVPTPDAIDDLVRVPVLTMDLGDGLRRETVLYPYQSSEEAKPVELLDRCEAYALGVITLEMSDRKERHRQVGLIHDNGYADHHFTAAQWLQIADLLRREEVYAALQRWAAEDAEIAQQADK